MLFLCTVLQDVWTWEPQPGLVLHEQPGPTAGGQGLQRVPAGGDGAVQQPAVPEVDRQRVERGGNLLAALSFYSHMHTLYSHSIFFALTQCLVTCGKGMRHRQVSCSSGARDEKLSDHFCDPSGKPSAVGSCELPECASWQVGVWGAVSPKHMHAHTHTRTHPSEVSQM